MTVDILTTMPLGSLFRCFQRRGTKNARLITDEAEKLTVLEMAQKEYGENASWRPEY